MTATHDSIHCDAIPLEDAFSFAGPDQQGMYTAQFYAFNTVVTLQGFGAVHGENSTETNVATNAETDAAAGKRCARENGNAGTGPTLEASVPGPGETCRAAFEAARDRCRFFERTLSRTLPHSDISRLNNAGGAWVEIQPETYTLLEESLRYCAESGGVFDITMGVAVRLWDFHHGIIPEADALAQALEHVDWRTVELKIEAGTYNPAHSEKHRQTREASSAPCSVGCVQGGEGRPILPPGPPMGAPEADSHEPAAPVGYFARLADPSASVDVGGTAKGFIADDLGELLKRFGLSTFVVNLGGNVLAHGVKPNRSAWRIGLQDPRHKHEDAATPQVIGAVAFTNASAVTSGVNERSFTRNGVLYHHILSAQTGYPVATDVASVTVIAQRSLDAEGYSTTLLALGRDAGMAFVHEHPAIAAAYFIDAEGHIYQA